MVLQVKDADGQGELWDSADGTRWGTRGLRQRQLPLCPSLLRVPLQACHPWYRGGRVEAPCPSANRSQLGWGCSRGTEMGHPQVPTGGLCARQFPTDTPLGGRTDSSSASVFLPPSPHPSPPAMGWERKWPYHLCSPNQAAVPKPKPTETGTLVLVGALVQALVPALWDRKQVIHLPGTPCSHL